jgi:DNA primase
MEGYTDVISSHEAGITNCVAPLGTSFTSQQVKMLSRYLTPAGERLSRGRIVCLFDGDEAGLKAAERAMQFVTMTTAGMYCVVIPGGADPAEYIAAQGAQALRDRIAQRVPLVRFVIDRHLDRFDVSTPEGRSLALADVVGAMGPIKGTSLADDYIDYVAGRLLADPSTVRGALANVRWTPPREDEGEEAPIVTNRQTSLGLGAPVSVFDDVAHEALPRSAVRLLPEDARMLQLERELLSALSSNAALAKAFADRVAQLEWHEPSHEAVAWAILAASDDETPLEILNDAEAVCPGAAQILAQGAQDIAEEKTGDAIDVILDEIEIAELRRRIDAGRGELRSLDQSDAQAMLAKLSELSPLQRRMQELEDKRRNRI